MELAIGTMQNSLDTEITGCCDEAGTSESTTNKEIVREDKVNEPMNESTIETHTKEEEEEGSEIFY
jgi:hypothetical protein